MSRVVRARLGVFAGLLILGAGLYLAIGLGWALVAVGAGVAATFVWLYQVDEPQPVDSNDIRTRRGLGL